MSDGGVGEGPLRGDPTEHRGEVRLCEVEWAATSPRCSAEDAAGGQAACRTTFSLSADMWITTATDSALTPAVTALTSVGMDLPVEV